MNCLPVSHLNRVDSGRSVVVADKHVVVFVFNHAILEFGPINHGRNFGQITIETHLLAQATVGRCSRGLTRPRVPATGVGPKPGRVVFGGRTLLQQQVAFSIENENGKGPVQTTATVNWVLQPGTDFLAFGINQNHLFCRVKHVHTAIRSARRHKTHQRPAAISSSDFAEMIRKAPDPALV